MKDITTADLIGQIHAIETELASRKARVRVTIDTERYHALTGVSVRTALCQEVCEISGLSRSDAATLVDNANVDGAIYIFEFVLSISIAVNLRDLDHLGHRYEILP